MTAVARAALLAVVVGVASASAVPASAQPAASLPAGRFEFGVDVTAFGGTSFGARDASLTSAGGGRFRLFSSDTTLGAAIGGDVRVGFSLSRVFEVDGTFSYARPAVRVSLANDAEQASPLVASESMHQFIVDVSLVAHVRRWTFRDRAVPFVSAGAGYLRDLHAGQILAESGQTYHVGGGLKYQLRTRTGRRVKATGLRAEVSMLARVKGTAIDNKAHVAPVATAGLFVRF